MMKKMPSIYRPYIPSAWSGKIQAWVTSHPRPSHVGLNSLGTFSFGVGSPGEDPRMRVFSHFGGFETRVLEQLHHSFLKCCQWKFDSCSLLYFFLCPPPPKKKSPLKLNTISIWCIYRYDMKKTYSKACETFSLIECQYECSHSVIRIPLPEK